MPDKKIINIIWLIFFILSVFLMNGCTPSYNQVVGDIYKKQPTHIKNVPPSGPTAIGGTWFNPSVGKQCSFIHGREVIVWQISFQTPLFPSVLVRDIKQVAPGRYRGVPMVHKQKATHVTYSIIGKNKLLSRWHYKSGKKLDVVYDKVKLTNEKWFLREYEAFLKESQTGSAPSQTNKNIVVQPSEDTVQSLIKDNQNASKSSVAVHRIYTKPGTIMPGTKFDLILEYTVTDSPAGMDQIPMTFNLEILKLKNNVQAPSMNYPVPPTQDNTNKVHGFKPVKIDCPNGKRTSRIVHLKATNEKGSYYLVAFLKYKKITNRAYIYFTIQ